MENAIQFALAVERPENAHCLPVLRDLCNTFGDDIDVFDEDMLEEFEEGRPSKNKVYQYADRMPTGL